MKKAREAAIAKAEAATKKKDKLVRHAGLLNRVAHFRTRPREVD